MAQQSLVSRCVDGGAVLAGEKCCKSSFTSPGAAAAAAALRTGCFVRGASSVSWIDTNLCRVHRAKRVCRHLPGALYELLQSQRRRQSFALFDQHTRRDVYPRT